MKDTKCCLCGKELFETNGKRLTNLCFFLAVGKREIKDNGWYGDGSMGAVHICKDCFSEEKKNKLINALWKVIKENEK